MGIGAHTYPAVAQASVPNLPVAPYTNVTTSSLKAGTYRNTSWQGGQPKAAVWLEKEQAFFIADGYHPMRLLIGNTFYRCGILPPTPDPIVTAPTGVRAEAHLNLTAQPNDGDSFLLGNGTASQVIVFKTTLVTNPGTPGYPGWQVLIDPGGVAATEQNVHDLINDQPGHNSTYHNAWKALGFPTYDWPTAFQIECYPITVGANIQFRATVYGAIGNTFNAQTVVDTAVVQTWILGGGGPPGYFVNGADGVGTAPEEGTYEYTYRYYRLPDKAFSGIGTRATESIGVPMNINLTMVDPSDDPEITHLEWMRSLHKSGQFYGGGMIKIGTGGAATDDKTDEAIGAGRLPYNDLEFRPFASGHVPSYRVVESHLGRVFGGGAFLLREKGLTLTTVKDSYAATPAAGFPWSSDMEGGILVFDTYDDEEYVAVDYDSGTNTVRLNKPWPHTGAALTATWRDGRDPTYLAWSQPGKPNQWPPANGLEGVQDETGEGITGLKAHWSRLNVFTPESIYALSGTDLFQLRRVVEGVGTASHHGIVEAEGNLYFPGVGAFWAWVGDERPINISNPPGEPRGIQDTIDSINWAMADQIVGHFDPVERVIRWTVPVNDEWQPNRVLVYDVANRAWHIDNGMVFDTFTTMTVGHEPYLLGACQGRFYLYGEDDHDNWYSAGFVGSITAVNASRHVFFDVSLFALGIGHSLGAVIVTAAGDYYPVHLIGGGSGVFAIWRNPDVIQNLTAGDQVIYGGILFYLRTGEMSFGYMGRVGRMTDLDIGFAPQTRSGRLYAAVDGDGSATALPEFGDGYGDLTAADGHFRSRINTAARRHTLDILTAFPRGRPEVVEIGVGYRTPGKRKASV
jgi:hypothetical protein